MQFTTVAFTAAMAALAVAAPTTPSTPLAKRVDDGAQSCTCQDHGAYGTWSVNIGAAYDGNYCNTVYNTLTANNARQIGNMAPTNWQCVDDGSGHYQLWFDMALENTGAGSTVINPTLTSLFPTINGFNCPDY